MTNEQVWHESTVMERCEILRSRLDLMEESLAVEPTYLPSAEIKPTPDDGYELISCDEYARLRRIEEAAKIAHVWLLVGGQSEASAACTKLGDALKRPEYE